MSDTIRAYVERAVADGELAPAINYQRSEHFRNRWIYRAAPSGARLRDWNETAGVVRVVGRGTFLSEGTRPTTNDALMTSPAEIMDTRLIIEPEIAFHAAQNATPGDLERIEMCMRRGNACESYVDFEMWDSAFHRAMAASVHNGLLLHSFDAMNAARDLPVWGSSKLRAATTQRRRDYEEQHDALLLALVDRDATGARTAMITHLESVRTNLLNPPS